MLNPVLVYMRPHIGSNGGMVLENTTVDIPVVNNGLPDTVQMPVQVIALEGGTFQPRWGSFQTMLACLSFATHIWADQNNSFPPDVGKPVYQLGTTGAFNVAGLPTTEGAA